MKELFVSLTDDEWDMMSTWKVMARFYCYSIPGLWARPGIYNLGNECKEQVNGLMCCRMPFLRDSPIHMMRLKVCIELLRWRGYKVPFQKKEKKRKVCVRFLSHRSSCECCCSHPRRGSWSCWRPYLPCWSYCYFDYVGCKNLFTIAYLT